MAPRTPLLRPDRYFANREPDLARGLAVAAIVTLAAIVLIAGLGAVFTAKIDGTVLVDNPERPPDMFCDGGMNETFEETNASFDCSAPAEIERDVDRILDRALGEFYGLMAIGMPIVLLIAAGLLHAGTALVNGDGSFGKTLSVTAWGFAPTVVTLPIGLLALWLLMDPVTITPGTDPAAIEAAILGTMQPWLPAALALNLVTSVWGVAIWTFGLERGRSVTRAQAVAVAAVVMGLLAVGGLL